MRGQDSTGSSREQKNAVQRGIAEKLCSGITPCLFHDAEDRAWVRLLDKDHYETFAVDNPAMSHHLEGLYYQETKRNSGRGEAIPDKLLRETLKRLRVMALHDGEEKKVFLRVGALNSRVLYIDLCDKQRRVVRISPTGWELEDQPPIFFRGTRDMLRLPVPERGGSIDELEPFLNVSGGDHLFW
jgi:hypothetical protein